MMCSGKNYVVTDLGGALEELPGFGEEERTLRRFLSSSAKAASQSCLSLGPAWERKGFRFVGSDLCIVLW